MDLKETEAKLNACISVAYTEQYFSLYGFHARFK